VLYGGPELAGGAPRVSGGVRIPKTPFLSITGNNREPLGRLALQALQVPAVIGHLQQGGDLHLAGELGVGHVVGVRANRLGRSTRSKKSALPRCPWSRNVAW